ncbi:MAG: alpha-L-rhamnosidase [Bacteroidales bacterium]|nr:alpha-L-rhamnosidase [Bacteroidales bacterium]
MTLIALILSASSGGKNQPADRKKLLPPPSGLTVECIREPGKVTISDRNPELGWVVPDEAVRQLSYQVLIASTPEKILGDEADVWDSGEVKSSESTNAEVKGNVLSPGSRYFWKVRIRGSSNLMSDWSAPQEFRIGMPGKWISSANSIEVERISPLILRQTGTGSWFADFGKAAFGTIELLYDSTSDDTLVIRLGEKPDKGVIDRNPGGTIRYSETKLPVKAGKAQYTLKLMPDKRNTQRNAAVILPDTFDVITPFRYCEIDNARGTLVRENLRQKSYFGYFDNGTSHFESSDTVLNRVWDLCKYSIKATSFAGIYIDGDRERIPYEADAYINQLSHYAVDREYAIARSTIEWFMEKPTWPTEWQLHVAMLFMEDYMYTGNTELIEKYYERLKHKTLMGLESDNGLISTASPRMNGEFMATLGFADTTQRLRDIVDWPPAQKDTGWKLATPEGERDGVVFMPFNTVVNSFYYRNMVIMTEFARILGKKNDESEFRARADRTRKAINEKMYNKASGHYTDGEGTSHGSVHANMLPLAFGIVPEEYREPVVSHVKTRGMACSVYGAQFLLDGLYENGASDYALELMTATHDRSWWNMIKAGSTITLEAWDMKYKPNSDWNHAWGAAPANIIMRGLWGIVPAKPGFEEVLIKPRPGSLESCSISVPTLKGSIRAAYRLVSREVKEYRIVLPANTSGYFVLPAGSAKNIRVNGKKIKTPSDKITLHPGETLIGIVSEGL